MPGLKTVNDDLVFENNELVLVDGLDLVEQLLRQRLQTFLGEWFLDTSLGLPYFQDILVKNPNANVVTSLLKDAILNTPGVIELVSFTPDFDSVNRSLNLSFSVRANDGEITITNLILGEFV